MKKLLILALTLVAVPLLAMAAAEESVTMTPEVTPAATVEASEAPAMTVADPVAILAEDGEGLKELLTCIDTDEPCFSFKDCLGACGGLPCTCLNGTCQYCP